jgi:hypothetical protein
MTEVNSEVAKESNKAGFEKKGFTVDLDRMYQVDAEKLTPDITHCRYSNLAYIQVTERDVYIDFLEMPGVKRDDRQVINGIRVYMTHASAQKLSGVLHDILEDVAKAKGMEIYEPKGKK